MARVLVLEDEPNMRKLIEVHLRSENHTLVMAGSIAEALGAIEKQDFDVVLTDQKLPDGEGLKVLDNLVGNESPTALVVLTAFGTVELAVETMRKGAFDFLTKPFAGENLKAVIARAAQHSLLRRENVLLRNAVDSLESRRERTSSQEHVPSVERLIQRVGPTDATVLITGETGTGKELVARAVHRISNRAGKPLISVNCAAFSETLLESELFGHEKGAFTGAERLRLGLFETAHQGTLFLDEAGEMSPAAQAKLLRVLAEGKINRVGSTVSRDVDVRVLVATHRNLLQEVERGRFRQDLYYRLAIVPIEVPPLRERMQDIPALTASLLRQITSDVKLPARTVHPDVLRQLQQYRFPGNIRELRNLLERACILSNGPEILSVDLPSPRNICEQPLLPDEFDLRTLLAEWEREALVQTLQKTRGMKAEAARRLGISKSDMTYRLTKFGITPLDKEEGHDK